jgi:tetratricopeptide (TPR) repeat protein
LKYFILFSLSALLIDPPGDPQIITNISKNCSSKSIQDSLIEKYITNRAEKLPGLYNDPNWIFYCDSVIALCPDIAYTYQMKAVPYIQNGEYEKAMELVNKAVELDPEEYTDYRGFLKFVFAKDYHGALIDFKKAQELNPKGYAMNHTYSFYEGLCNLELKNYSSAEENFKQDILIQKESDKEEGIHFNSSFYSGVLYYEMGNYNQAKEHLLNCLHVYPQYPIANFYLALVYKSEGNDELKRKYVQVAKHLKGNKSNVDSFLRFSDETKLNEIEALLNEELKADKN